MARVVVELTNRCNLNCQHCFSGRHGGKDNLPLSILQTVLNEARDFGFDHLAFTGGDPTVHHQFSEVLCLTWEAGYTFSLVTNGWNFTAVYPRILPYRDRLLGISFSLDGAREETHDRLRGRGSYRRVMQAVSICVALGLPFSLNMVVTAHNRHQLAEMAELASALGSRSLRYMHLMPTSLTARQGLDLSPEERKEVEEVIWGLRKQSQLPITMAAGFHTTSLFPCAPLRLKEVNIDCRGNLTKCCQISGHGDGAGQEDIIGNLAAMSFADAYRLLLQENQRFHQEKLRRFDGGAIHDSDFFPCWYCSVYYQKVGWLQKLKDHPWSSLVAEQPSGFEVPRTVFSIPIRTSSTFPKENYR